jgi:hypothetical protein
MFGIILALLASTYLPTVPGATNPDVTQETIATTICVSGWTKTIRPPASYTTRLKKAQMADLGLPGTTHDYEEDHLISLEIGGNPTDPANLWPEPWVGEWNAHKKDQLENRLHRMVCSGEMQLVDAQYAITHDWTAAYLKLIGSPD